MFTLNAIRQVAVQQSKTRWSYFGSLSRNFQTSSKYHTLNLAESVCRVQKQALYPTLYFQTTSRSLSTARPPSPPLSNDNDKKKKVKLGDLFNQYGPVFAVYYFSLWSSSAVVLYGLVSSGVVGPTAGLDVIRFLHLDSLINVQNINPDHGNVGLAMLLNEMLEPARLALAVTTTPMVARKWNSFRGTDPNQPSGTPKKKSRAREIAEKYGFFFTVYWGTMYASMFAGTFASIHYGVLNVDVVLDLMRRIELDSYVQIEAIDSPLGHAALALGINEVMEWIRLPFVMATTPMLHKLIIGETK